MVEASVFNAIIWFISYYVGDRAGLEIGDGPNPYVVIRHPDGRWSGYGDFFIRLGGAYLVAGWVYPYEPTPEEERNHYSPLLAEPGFCPLAWVADQLTRRGYPPPPGFDVERWLDGR